MSANGVRAIFLRAGLTVFLLASPASAATDTIYKYSSPKTGIVSISTMAFSPDSASTSGKAWLNKWFGNILTGDGCFNAAVNLPNGATITNYRVVYTTGIYSAFVATARETGESTYLALISRDEATSDRMGFSEAVDPVAVVNNVKYQYGVGICLTPDQTFNGARIQYTYTNAGD